MLIARLLIPACGLLLLNSCSASPQGQPAFDQEYGAVDEPCVASKVVARCTAHVLLVNHGGEGLGHATIVVPVRNSTETATSARVVATAKCGTRIPDTTTGGFADLTCDFELPVGKSVAGPPSLSSVDFTAAASTGSAGVDGISIATLVAAAVAGLLSVVALVAAIAGRRRGETS